jgi:uncharacterized membrane protein
VTRPSDPNRATIELPSRTDPIVAGLSQAVGGPVGAHALLRRRFWTPLRIVLALTCLVMAFNWVQKSPSRDGNWPAEHLPQYNNASSTDVLALYYAEGLGKGQIPYLDHDVEYPVLTGVMMGAIGLPVHWVVHSGIGARITKGLAAVGLAVGGAPNEGKWFYDATAIALGGFALLTTWAIARMRTRRPWDAAMFALAPAMFLTATVNWDLLAVALTTMSLFAWSKRHPVWAGVLLGLAISAKFYPLLILGPLILLCLRRRAPIAIAYGGITVAATAFTWLLINLPVLLIAPKAWTTFYSFSRTRGVDWGTFWYIGSHLPRGQGADGQPRFGLGVFNSLAGNVPRLNTVAWVLFALCCAGIAALILWAPRPPRLGAVAFLVVATFLLTNKVWSQQFVLWLIPLAVLARPRWGAFLAWQACELAYFFGFYQILLRTSGGKAVLPEVAFTWASVARWLSLAVLCGLVVYEALRPDADVVRRNGEDDPDGGPLDESTGPPGPTREIARTPLAPARA